MVVGLHFKENSGRLIKISVVGFQFHLKDKE